VLNLFRFVSVLEGLSYLLILSVTLGLISREFVSSLGMAHGVLFLAYVVLSLMLSGKRNWPVGRWLMLFVASLIPFAFILVEVYFRRSDKHELKVTEPVA